GATPAPMGSASAGLAATASAGPPQTVTAFPVGPPSGSPSGSPSPSPSPTLVAGNQLDLTAADSGQSYTAAPGTRISLTLSGSPQDAWTPPRDSAPAVLHGTGTGGTKGSQHADYVAAQVGRATLSATQNPACVEQRPMCGIPSRSFMVTIVVTQRDAAP
ncbi:MAG: hypothetical protein ACYDB7_02420, partial [Mycobacteriales bacterium]